VLDDGRVVFVETFQGRLSIWDRNHGVQAACRHRRRPQRGSSWRRRQHLHHPKRRDCRPMAITGHNLRRSSASVPQAAWTRGHHDDVAGAQRPTSPSALTAASTSLTREANTPQAASPTPDTYACSGRTAPAVLQETGRAYPNGIVVEPDGSIVWVESYTRVVRRRRTNSA
jgi:sugar lactone lactonase YvrE